MEMSHSLCRLSAALGCAALVGATALAGGCDETPDIEEGLQFDAGADFALGPQSTHVGAAAVTCCLVTNLGTAHVLYLASPTPGSVDRLGVEHPATGELHLANPYGVDLTLGKAVPAFGYGFSPDGRAVLFMGKSTEGYSLNIATITSPELDALDVKNVINDGLDDSKLGDQSFYTPSGQYLIVGVRPPRVVHSPDLYVIDVQAKKSVYHLGGGAFSYLEMMTGSDTMVFQNSTASTEPGTPSVQGLYILNLAAAQGSTFQPSLLDTHTAQVSLFGDGQTVVYTRSTGEMMMLDLSTNDFVQLATGVVSFSLGPFRRGPIVYVTNDLAIHVRPKLQPEILATAPGTIDLFSPVSFSPNGQHMYFFRNVNSGENHGDLMHLFLPPAGDGKMNVVETRVSLKDLTFTENRLLYLRNVDGKGDFGELMSAALDGTNPFSIATGVATGDLHVAYPRPPEAPIAGRPGLVEHTDMAMPPPAPVFANLIGTQRTDNITPIDGSRPLAGALAFGPGVSSPEATVNGSVHTGSFSFSDDGYLLLYAADATYTDKLHNWVGHLAVFTTILDVAPSMPSIDGVSELGPIVNRSLFVNAPGASPPGIYYVKY
jgi:hypothetical protein